MIEDKKGNDFFTYLLVILTVLFTAKPVSLFNIDFTGVNSYVFLLLFIIISFLKRLQISKNFIYVTLILVAINSIALIKYQTFYPRFFLMYWFAIYNAYIVIKLAGDRLFKIFDNVLFMWSLYIIMPIYIISQFAPSLLINFLMNLPFSNNDSVVYSGRIYSFLFCYIPDAGIRNSGFGWEPGIFASIIIMGVFSNLMVNQFRISLRFWIYSLIIFSTMSTTGFIMLGIFFIWIYMNRYLKRKFNLLILPVLIFGLFFLITSPIITNKFDYSVKQSKNVERLIKKASKQKEVLVHPQRFASFLITTRDISENPVFGALGNFGERWYKKKYGNLENFVVVSGIGNFLTIFGFLGLFVFIYLTSRSIILLKFEYGLKNGYMLLVLILGISFSYYIFISPLFYCFIFYAVFRLDFPYKRFKNLLVNQSTNE
jgi:hypothetical protein